MKEEEEEAFFLFFSLRYFQLISKRERERGQ